MIVLTPPQITAKKYIEWLMSDDWNYRGIGKSYLMAIIFIEKAINHPTLWINVWDHGPHHPKKEEFMLRSITNIIQEHYPEWNFKIKHSDRAFCMERKEK